MSYREHRYESHDGLSLAYRSYGSGPETVLCLHGLTRNAKDFEALATHLAPHWRVVTPDLRGRGRSDRDPRWRNYLPPTYVRDVRSLLDHLGLDRAVVIGTSLGGLVAMLLADLAPDRLRAVILNDVGPEVAPAAVARILSYVGRIPPQPDWDAAVRLVRETYQVAYPGEDSAFWERQTRAAWRERPDGKVEPDHDPAIGDALRHAARSAPLLRLLQRLGKRRIGGVHLDRWDDFRALEVPVLALRGELSDVLTRPLLARMEQELPALRCAIVPGRGHAPTLDEPAARAAIDAFLASL